MLYAVYMPREIAGEVVETVHAATTEAEWGTDTVLPVNMTSLPPQNAWELIGKYGSSFSFIIYWKD